MDRIPDKNIPDTEIKVKRILDKLKPYLMKDGGDIELVKVSTDGYAEVKFLGSCSDCPLKPMTLRAGIERSIMLSVPEIIRVESVS